MCICDIQSLQTPKVNVIKIIRYIMTCIFVFTIFSFICYEDSRDLQVEKRAIYAERVEYRFH